MHVSSLTVCHRRRERRGAEDARERVTHGARAPTVRPGGVARRATGARACRKVHKHPRTPGVLVHLAAHPRPRGGRRPPRHHACVAVPKCPYESHPVAGAAHQHAIRCLSSRRDASARPLRLGALCVRDTPSARGSATGAYTFDRSSTRGDACRRRAAPHPHLVPVVGDPVRGLGGKRPAAGDRRRQLEAGDVPGDTSPIGEGPADAASEITQGVKGLPALTAVRMCSRRSPASVDCATDSQCSRPM